jgi:hypothetical protein
MYDWNEEKPKQTLEIAETAADPKTKTKLQARAIANDCYKYIMDLMTNGAIITDGIKYIDGKMNHLNNEQNKILEIFQPQQDGEATTRTATAAIDNKALDTKQNKPSPQAACFS